MKILHKYEDGTLKIAYSNGEVGLLLPIKSIDAKIIVSKDEDTFGFALAGIPVQIENTDDARWMRLCGTHYSEILFKIIVNAGMICAKALGPEAFQHFSKCVVPIRDIICKKEEPSNDL